MVVIYCQACGTQNEDGYIDCRFCGRLRSLNHEDGEGLATDAIFDATCGVPSPLAAVAAAAAARDAGVVEAGPPDWTVRGGSGAIGLDRALPDWIKRTDGRTPATEHFDPTSVDTPPPSGFVLVADNAGTTAVAGADEITFLADVESAPSRGSTTFDGDDRPSEAGKAGPFGDHLLGERAAASASNLPDHGADEPPAPLGGSRPLPPLPDGGLAESMPDWLRARPAGPMPAVVDEAAVLARPSPDANRFDGATGNLVAPDLDASIDADSTAIDPTSFISEVDLPLWIRQLVANEEGKAEEASQTALAAEERARAQQPEEMATHPDLLGRLAAAQPAPPAGPSPTLLAPSEWPAALLGSPASAPVKGALGGVGPDVVAAEGGEGASEGRGTEPLDLPMVDPVATPPIGTPPQQPVSGSSLRTEPTTVPPTKRYRRLLPIALAVILVVLALVAYLLSSGIFP